MPPSVPHRHRRVGTLLAHLVPAAEHMELAVEEAHSFAEAEAAARAMIGGSVSALDTPALMIDLDAVEANIAEMAASVAASGAIWRPHCKAIRSPALAKMLVDGGAVGITCAKLTQAVAMADAGIDDMLIANEIVGRTKVQRLVALANRLARLCVAVDNESNLRMISEEAAAAGATVGVLVDLNVGMDRCGVHWSKQAEIVGMCQLAAELPAIDFRGLMGYEGHAQGAENKDELTMEVAERLAAAKRWVEATGLAVPLVSGSGSGNYYVSKDLGASPLPLLSQAHDSS